MTDAMDKTYCELPAQRVPEIANVDVVVCGGGPAGIGAAVAAAREGARTMLVEASEALGGMCTSGLVNNSPIVAGARGGVFRELSDRVENMAPNGRVFQDRNGWMHGWAWVNSELWKIACLDLLAEHGVSVLFRAFAHDLVLHPEAPPDARAAGGVVIAAKGGRQIIRAGAVVDATADGDVAASAGAPFDKGRDGDGKLQAVSFNFKLAGVKSDRIEPWASFTEIADRARAEGRLNFPLYVRGNLGRQPPVDAEGIRHFQFDTAIDIDASDALSRTKGLREGYARVREVYELLRTQVRGFEDATLVAIAPQLGVRETRRFRGLATVTEDDVLGAHKFADGIARASFYMDLHDGDHKSPEYKRQRSAPEGDWYEIRYGALVPQGVDRLLVAGRCISSTRPANGSLRVQPTCMATGEAAGIAAAWCARDGVSPKNQNGEAIRARLLVCGAEL